MEALTEKNEERKKEKCRRKRENKNRRKLVEDLERKIEKEKGGNKAEVGMKDGVENKQNCRCYSEVYSGRDGEKEAERNSGGEREREQQGSPCRCLKQENR